MSLIRQNADDCLRLRGVLDYIKKTPLGTTINTMVDNARSQLQERGVTVTETQLQQCAEQIWNEYNNDGGARKSSSHVSFHGAKRKVHLDGRKKYIKFNGDVVYLKDIRGKYHMA